MTNPDKNDYQRYNAIYDRDELCAYAGKLGFLWVSGMCAKSFFVHPDVKSNSWELSVDCTDDNNLSIEYSPDLPDEALFPLIGFCSLRGIKVTEVND